MKKVINETQLQSIVRECVKRVLSEEKYDRRGFGVESGLHRDTGTNRDTEGYNKLGLDKRGFGRDGYGLAGWDKDGYNRKGYNKEGYNRDGFDKEGYNKEGYNRAGFNKEGYNKEGFGKTMKATIERFLENRSYGTIVPYIFCHGKKYDTMTLCKTTKPITFFDILFDIENGRLPRDIQTGNLTLPLEPFWESFKSYVKLPEEMESQMKWKKQFKKYIKSYIWEELDSAKWKYSDSMYAHYNDEHDKDYVPYDDTFIPQEPSHHLNDYGEYMGQW